GFWRTNSPKWGTNSGNFLDLPSAEKGREPPQTGGGSGGGSGFCPAPERRGRIHDPTGEVLILPPGNFYPVYPCILTKKDRPEFFYKKCREMQGSISLFLRLTLLSAVQAFPGKAWQEEQNCSFRKLPQIAPIPGCSLVFPPFSENSVL
ncbi:MAG TPA: hypothetical protein VEI81_06670, partial [Methanoregula sp.]|nr:hypothetical protein [Methanoregula sp.]